ncbi:MAG: BON domain-containing protein [Syntrophobacteraceae bacterium]
MRKIGILLMAFALVLGPIIVSFADQSAKQAVHDGAITAAVKARIAKDVGMGVLPEIEISTKDGVVTLAGKVKSENEKKQLEEAASEVNGVKGVNTHLQVVS